MTTEKKPHKWAKEIHAWADGAEIQARFDGPGGRIDWEPFTGVWLPGWEYRIKPEPVVEVAHISHHSTIWGPFKSQPAANVRFTFDPTTGELIDVERIPKEVG